jgi:hypothetical protein
MVSFANYWAKYETLRFDGCGDALHLANGNALSLENVLSFYCARGIIYDGDSSNLSGIHTQEVLEDLVLLASDSTTVSNSYLEDTGGHAGSGSGTGKYAVTLGVSSGVTKHSGLQLNGIRVGSARSGKKAFRLWGLSSAKIASCRQYSHGVDADSTSTGSLVNTDFPEQASLSAVKWIREIGGGLAAAQFFTGGSGICVGKYAYSTGYVDSGTIAANTTISYTFTFPSSFVMPTGTAVISVQPTSGGDDRCLIRGRINGGRTGITIYVSNPTAAGIAFGVNLYLSIELWV